MHSACLVRENAAEIWGRNGLGQNGKAQITADLHFSTRVGWNIWTADYKYSTGGYLTAGALCRKLGFVQGAMLDELYSNAYIYTLPSDLEGMPLSLLEAMSYGNCCLVSDIPECAEVVEDKALIFKKSDVCTVLLWNNIGRRPNCGSAFWR